jgi:two-component system, NtrC family, response regulator HydG
MNPKNGKFLIIDDNEDILSAARLLLKQHAALVHTEEDPRRIPALMKDETYDVILLDMNFAKGATGGEEGFVWLRRILAADPMAVVILITAFGDVGMAVRAIKEGATDFILKPWQNEKLLATLSAALSLRASRLEARSLRQKQGHLSADLDRPYRDFLGRSPAMAEVLAAIDKVAGTDASILILGENGTGKELAAREIHRRSLRRGEIFVGVDMSAIPETLFESELFGHVKGAFTDAREDRAGRFETASGGTLFLDEIGNLSFPLQAKILTALENRRIYRVGSNKPETIDIRLICATNRPIHKMVAENGFRQDLLYRINTIELRMPPLRERKTDIPLLTDHFLAAYCLKYGRPLKAAGPATLRKLEDYGWPGNVRELMHAVERAVIMSESAVLQPEDFPLTPAGTTGGDGATEPGNLEDMERRFVERILSKHGGNVSKAARELGLSRAALYRRLEKHGL